MEENKTMSCINCNVTSCIHNTEQNRCDAGEIKVAGFEANTTHETCCDTFKSRDCCNI